MTITSELYESGSYSHAQLAEMFESFMTSGYITGYEDALAVSAVAPADMKVSIATGRARILGYWFENPIASELDIEAASGVYSRIDRVILRLDATSTLQIGARILKGTAAASPSAPALAGDGTEISLAQILIGAGVDHIDTADITDERDDTTVCGVAGITSALLSEIAFTADHDMETHTFTGLADPTADQDAVTKKYFDDNTAGTFGTSKCEIVPCAATDIPAGWLECDGASLLRASYPDLFSAFGTTYGSADGTHFNLPNLKGKAIYGATSSLGTTAGAKTHQLTTAEMPAHAHSGGTTTSSGIKNVGGGGSWFPVMEAGATDSAGSDTAHNNLHPYIVLRYIVRAS